MTADEFLNVWSTAEGFWPDSRAVGNDNVAAVWSTKLAHFEHDTVCTAITTLAEVSRNFPSLSVVLTACHDILRAERMSQQARAMLPAPKPRLPLAERRARLERELRGFRETRRAELAVHARKQHWNAERLAGAIAEAEKVGPLVQWFWACELGEAIDEPQAKERFLSQAQWFDSVEAFLLSLAKVPV